MPVEVWMVLALYWIILMGLFIWLVWAGSDLDRRIKEMEE